jgi:3-deoxy-D-manno-octulosonic-acid transferase
MRILYTLLLYFALPVVLLYLLLRGLRDGAYLRRWQERFGRFSAPQSTGGIVVHAASMGEVNAAAALIQQLSRLHSDAPLYVTTLTPTGSGRVRALFGSEVFHVYAPIDLPGSVRRFLDRTRPRLLVVMETEIWPNLYHEAQRRNVPIVIVNARISPNSIGRYRRLHRLIGPALSSVAAIGAQSAQDATRFLQLGAPREKTCVTGNLKFDIRLPPGLIEEGEAIRSAWGVQRPVLLAGSTHEGDELPLLESFGRVLDSFPTALLVLVPRHPERFGRAAQLARAAGLRVALRSESISCPADSQCFLVDSVGELLRFYAACDAAFVGGSLDAIGGHNVLEPAALAKPVLFGPHTFHFADIARQLLDHGAALEVRDAAELEAATRRLFSDPELRDRMGRAAYELVRSGEGAVERTLQLLESTVTPATG